MLEAHLRSVGIYNETVDCMNAFAFSIIEEIDKEAEKKQSYSISRDSRIIEIPDLKKILNKYKEGLK